MLLNLLLLSKKSDSTINFLFYEFNSMVFFKVQGYVMLACNYMIETIITYSWPMHSIDVVVISKILISIGHNQHIFSLFFLEILYLHKRTRYMHIKYILKKKNIMFVSSFIITFWNFCKLFPHNLACINFSDQKFRAKGNKINSSVCKRFIS